MLLISYICGIVSVELKLLQVLYNRSVVLKPRRKKKKKAKKKQNNLTYNGRQKASLKV